MEFCDAGSVLDILEKTGKGLPENVIAPIIKQVLFIEHNKMKDKKEKKEKEKKRKMKKEE